MGERHLFGLDQLQEYLRRIAAGENQLHARERRGVRAAPGMNMEHGRHRHVDVVAMKAALAGREAVFDQAGQGVQHDLAMAEEDALRPARRPGRMKGGRAGVFVEIGERIVRRAERQQGLIFAFDREVGFRRLGAVVHEDVGLDRLQVILEFLHQRQKVSVEEDRRRAAVVDRVGDVLGRKAHVDHLQDSAHHRHCEIALVIAVAVPFEDGDDVALIDANLGKTAGEPPDALAEGPVGVASEIAVDDLLIRRAHHRGVQEMLDQQRIGIGRRRRRNDLDRHDASSLR